MGLLNPQNFVYGLSLALLVLIYLRSRSRPAIEVSSLMLFDEVPAPDAASGATVAVQIRGHSLGALFDNWLVFYDDVRDPPGDDLVGRMCVCGLADGRILVKALKRSQVSGLWNLLSNLEPPIYDVALDWAAVVREMRPR